MEFRDVLRPIKESNSNYVGTTTINSENNTLHCIKSKIENKDHEEQRSKPTNNHLNL